MVVGGDVFLKSTFIGYLIIDVDILIVFINNGDIGVVIKCVIGELVLQSMATLIRNRGVTL